LSPVRLVDHPLLVFVISFFSLWLSAWIGASFFRWRRKQEETPREDIGVILAATLTLLGLIIGFTFSMAVNRYDQRKNYEEAEANAISTEYVRADLLPAADAERVRELLKDYLDQRILFYRTHDKRRLAEINARTAELQTRLWSAVKAPASVQQTPIVALAVSGMNDVLNSQGYTQAAWWNRIPIAAWGLMASIAICCNLLIGYSMHDVKDGPVLLLVLPLVASVAFLLIADIDSPRGGIIRLLPENLISLSQSVRGH
jgi:hypothetical protein